MYIGHRKREREEDRQRKRFPDPRMVFFILTLLGLGQQLSLMSQSHQLYSMPECDQLLDTPEFNTITVSEKKYDDYSLARRQSLGFFDDITSSTWKRLQKKFLDMSPNFCDFKHDNPEVLGGWFGRFFQCHYEPDFVCLHEERIGLQGDGGKWVCDPHRIAQNVKNGGECLVYSIGSRGDFSFEKGVHEKVHEDCEIHTFDFGNYAGGTEEAGVIYHQQGLGRDHTDGQGRIFKSLSTTVEELGHQNRIIDIFKIDCEGCEFETALDWFETEAKHNVTLRQIQVELHYAPPERIHAFFDLMYEHGYVIFHKEINMIAFSFHPGNSPRGKCIEYAFLKLDLEFANVVPRTKAVEALAAERNQTSERR